MRKRIIVPVDKLIARSLKTVKQVQEKPQGHKSLTFQELYSQARKQSHNTRPYARFPYYSANTSQQCSESLKSSVHTPQNSNRNFSRKQDISDKLNRSLQAKSNSLEKLPRPVRSFSSEKKLLVQQWKTQKNSRQNLKQFKYDKQLKQKAEVNPAGQGDEHFFSQFKSIINRLDHNNHSHLRQTECFLTIEETFHVMKQLRYLRKIQDEKHLVKLWQQLEGETYGGIPSLNLYQFFSYINSYNPAILLPQSHKSKDSNSHKKIIINSNLKIVISQQSKLLIYEQYLALRVNRILYGSSEMGAQKNRESTSKRTSNIKIVDDDVQKSQKKLVENQRKKGSFVKKIPGASQTEVVSNAPLKRAVRLKSSVNRIKKVEETLQKDKSEETICYSEISETKESGQNLTSNQSDCSIQNSQTNQQVIQRKPILSIDVNLGEGISQKLLVYEGETALEVSRRLVEKYNIDQSLRVKFQGMLNGHIRNLLWRIEQVSEEMFSDRQQ